MSALPQAETLLQMHRCQLLLWKRIIGKVLVDAAPEDWLQVGLDRLLQDDSHLVAINAMGAQARRVTIITTVESSAIGSFYTQWSTENFRCVLEIL